MTVSSTGPGGVVTLTGTEQDDDFWITHRIMKNTAWIEIEASSGGTPIIGPGCSAMDGDFEWATDTVKCPRPSRVEVRLYGGDDRFQVDTLNDPPVTIPVVVDGGPGNDALDASLADSTLMGGPGDDVLYGDAGNDRLDGGPGNDILKGRGGNDHLTGGDGNDTLDGHAGNDILDGGAGDDNLDGDTIAEDRGAGADTYIGGPGFDRFSYFMRSAPVSVTLDGVANDGEAGEGDNIHPDVEEVGGGWGDDILIGSAGDNILWGDLGNDTIRGLGGNDQLWGGDGNDVIDGGPGNDELKGGCHNDRLIGGPGVDSLISDDCTDFTKRGKLDILEANDGERDALIFCSVSSEAPADTAIVDPIDPVSNSGAGACATINIVAPAGGGAPTALTGKVSLRLGTHATLLTGTGNITKNQAAKQQLRLKGKVRTLTLGTVRATSAKVKVTAVATFRKGTRTIPLGKKTLTVTKAAPKTLTIGVPVKGAKAVGTAKRVKTKVAFTVRNARGKVVKKSTKTFPIAVARK